jgi:hypothetical protein
VPELDRARRSAAARAARRAALIAALALVPVATAACGDEANDGAAAGQTATVAETAGETATETATGETTETGALTPPEPSGPVVRFRGNGDRTLPPVQVGTGGATLAWRNGDAVFTLFSQAGTVIDTVEPRGEMQLPAGRYNFDIVASGDWSVEIRNARRAG